MGEVGWLVAWNNPIALERVLELLELLELKPGDAVLDLGCGSGELLGALGPRGIEGCGVDVDEEALEQARARWPALDWVSEDASSFHATNSPRLAICMGSTHAFGRGEQALTGACERIQELLRPGGWALIGEAFQRQPLPAAYAELLGEPSGIERTHLQNVQTIEAAGLDCRAAVIATDPEWEAFEWAFYRRRGNRLWRDAWLQHGRHTMGFAAYLARLSPG